MKIKYYILLEDEEGNPIYDKKGKQKKEPWSGIFTKRKDANTWYIDFGKKHERERNIKLTRIYFKESKCTTTQTI